MRILKSAEIAQAPYQHFTSPKAFDDEAAGGLLEWIKTSVQWKLHEESFFEQYEAVINVDDVPDTYKALFKPGVVNGFRKKAENIFNTKLEKKVKIVAHKLVDGQSIGIHNDNPHADTETHRLVVNLNDGYRDDFGGHFIMFNDPPSLDNIYQVLRPIHNTAVGFAACRHSFHAVNRVSNWERYSLIFSFWEKKKRRAQTFNIVDYEKTPLAKYLRFLISHHADEVSHSDAGLLSHLIDTYRMLKSWKCSHALCKAGLFHSIYGTQQFTNSLLGLDQRNGVRKLIGKTAEQLAYLFCICDKESLYSNIIRQQGPYWVANKHDGSKIQLSKEELKNLITLDAANSLEQIERVDIPMETLKVERDVYLQAASLLPEPALQAVQKAYSQLH